MDKVIFTVLLLGHESWHCFGGLFYHGISLLSNTWRDWNVIRFVWFIVYAWHFLCFDFAVSWCPARASWQWRSPEPSSLQDKVTHKKLLYWKKWTNWSLTLNWCSELHIKLIFLRHFSFYLAAAWISPRNLSLGKNLRFQKSASPKQ